MKRKSTWKLPPEGSAVMRASTNLWSCKRKYGRMPYDEFLERIRTDGCIRCRKLLVQLYKESTMIVWLREHKN